MKVYEIIIENDDWEISQPKDVFDELNNVKRQDKSLEHQSQVVHSQLEKNVQSRYTIPASLHANQKYPVVDKNGELHGFIDDKKPDAASIQQRMIRLANKICDLYRESNELEEKKRKIQNRIRTKQDRN